MSGGILLLAESDISRTLHILGLHARTSDTTAMVIVVNELTSQWPEVVDVIDAMPILPFFRWRRTSRSARRAAGRAQRRFLCAARAQRVERAPVSWPRWKDFMRRRIG